MFELKSLLIVLFLLFLEISLLFLILIGMLQRRIFAHFLEKIEEKRKAKITALVVSYLEEPRPFVWQRAFTHADILLSVLEAFNHRLSGGDWEKIKREIVALALSPKAKRSAKSWFWRKRSFAARVFALAPFPDEEPLILSLITDPVFLVRSTASLAAVLLESQKGIDLTLQEMAKQKNGYAHYYYRDILLQGATGAFIHMAKIAAEKRDRSLHLSCLEVFSGKTTPCPLPFLEEDLKSSDPELLLASLKVLARNPLIHTESIYQQALSHADPAIRAEAACGLKAYPSPQNLILLEQALKDATWEVRLQAAISLREMGEEGQAILKRQDAKTDKKAQEVAQYAMDFLG